MRETLVLRSHIYGRIIRKNYIIFKMSLNTTQSNDLQTTGQMNINCYSSKFIEIREEYLREQIQKITSVEQLQKMCLHHQIKYEDMNQYRQSMQQLVNNLQIRNAKLENRLQQYQLNAAKLRENFEKQLTNLALSYERKIEEILIDVQPDAKTEFFADEIERLYAYAEEKEHHISLLKKILSPLNQLKKSHKFNEYFEEFQMGHKDEVGQLVYELKKLDVQKSQFLSKSKAEYRKYLERIKTQEKEKQTDEQKIKVASQMEASLKSQIENLNREKLELQKNIREFELMYDEMLIELRDARGFKRKYEFQCTEAQTLREKQTDIQKKNKVLIANFTCISSEYQNMEQQIKDIDKEKNTLVSKNKKLMEEISRMRLMNARVEQH